jgi:hypothetical protein
MEMEMEKTKMTKRDVVKFRWTNREAIKQSREIAKEHKRFRNSNVFWAICDAAEKIIDIDAPAGFVLEQQIPIITRRAYKQYVLSLRADTSNKKLINNSLSLKLIRDKIEKGESAGKSESIDSRMTYRDFAEQIITIAELKNENFFYTDRILSDDDYQIVFETAKEEFSRLLSAMNNSYQIVNDRRQKRLREKEENRETETVA